MDKPKILTDIGEVEKLAPSESVVQSIQELNSKIDEVETKADKGVADSTKANTSIATTNASLSSLTTKVNGLDRRNYVLSTAKDERTINTIPSTYNSKGVYVNNIKNGSAVGLEGYTYAHVLGFNTWLDTTPKAYEVGFGAGATGKCAMFIRRSWSESVWEAWEKVMTEKKVEFTPTQSSAVRIVKANCFTKNDEFSLDVVLKASGGLITLSTTVHVLTLPFTLTTPMSCSVIGCTNSLGFSSSSATAPTINDISYIGVIKGDKVYVRRTTTSKVVGATEILISARGTIK